MPRSVGTSTRQLAGDLDLAVAQQQRGDRIAPDEREAAPALAVLDGLEQEPGPVADELGVRGDRASRGRPAARPTRARPCAAAARRAEVVAAGRLGLAVTRSLARGLARLAEAAVEAGALAGVAGAVAVLLRP